MKTPPFLVGAALVFWGWQTDFLAAGIIMAVVLESSRFVKVRWDFSDDDFARIGTVCLVLFLMAIAYAFTSNNGPASLREFWENPLNGIRQASDSDSRAAASFLRWTPMIFFLFMAAQAFNEREEIPLAAVSWYLRARRKREAATGVIQPALRTVNAAYPYFAICLMASSIHGMYRGRHFFWGIAALLAWALWKKRSSRYPPIAWAAVLGMAVMLGYGSQLGLGTLQRVIMEYNPEWFSDFYHGAFDPSQNRTRLGQIGQIKGSGRIVIRLAPKNGSRPPTYLREASYQAYDSPTWFAGSSHNTFESVSSGQNGTTWPLVPGKPLTNATNTISCYLDWWRDESRSGLLPLPTTAKRLENLRAYTLARNNSGAVMAEGPRLVIFDACDGPGEMMDSPPQAADLAPPMSGETDALERVIAEIHPAGTNTDDALKAVSAFFREKFTYSTWQGFPRKSKNMPDPLARFLLETHSGHCEYFATATVLLLRQLGIPARYAVGYMVHEASGKGYIVRDRDAHAWCLVWHNGTWENFDTTPASWEADEARRASPLEFLSDWWSLIQFEISKFKVTWGQSRIQDYLPLLAAPVLAVLLYQITFRRSWRWRKQKQTGQAATPVFPGQDSEFYELEKMLGRHGFPRQPAEPMSALLERAGKDPALAPLENPLQDVLRLHYRHRFDPRGLDGTARQELQARAKSCLDALGQLSVV